MRKGLLLLCLVTTPVLGEDPPLSFDEIVLRNGADARAAEEEVRLARLAHEIVEAREPATIEAEAGPRRLDSDAWKPQLGARFEMPILSGRDRRSAAASRLEDAGDLLRASTAVESRLRLRHAYLDAWSAQASLEVHLEDVATLGSLLATTRERVAQGAEASYEVALVEGDLLRARSVADRARAGLGEAWATLRELADVSETPRPLSAPGIPELRLPENASERFEAGTLRRALEQRALVESAFAYLELARTRSRWSALGEAGSEGDEAFATVGVAFQLWRPGEREALGAVHERTVEAIRRGSTAESAALGTRFQTALARAASFGEIPIPGAFDDALRAVALRIELGKERPSVALPVRRHLLEAKAAALERTRDACLLAAEIEALTAGGRP